MMSIWKTEEQAQYFLNVRRASLPLASEQINVMLNLIRTAGRPVNRFLDLGCGDGVLSRAIFTQYPNASGTLIDFSEPMIVAAKKQLTRRSVELMQHDLCDFSWVEKVKPPFDAIVSSYAIHHLPDECKHEIYRQAFELLSPGGMFINIERVASPTPWVEKIYEQTVIDAMYNRDQQSGGNTPREEIERMVYSQPQHGDITASVETQLEWLRGIGFKNVDCYMKIYALAVLGGMKP